MAIIVHEKVWNFNLKNFMENMSLHQVCCRNIFAVQRSIYSYFCLCHFPQVSVLNYGCGGAFWTTGASTPRLFSPHYSQTPSFTLHNKLGPTRLLLPSMATLQLHWVGVLPILALLHQWKLLHQIVLPTVALLHQFSTVTVRVPTLHLEWQQRSTMSSARSLTLLISQPLLDLRALWTLQMFMV